jgi:hypothetical protein
MYPLNLTLWQRGEKMTVKFEPAVGGGTRVTISGATLKSKQAKASDPQHWSQALPLREWGVAPQYSAIRAGMLGALTLPPFGAIE